MILRSLTAAAAALAAALALAATASAASIVFVKGGNVWVSAPDGSGAHALTTDGRMSDPYRSPSQADDGTIAVARGSEIVVLAPDGRRIRAFTPSLIEPSPTGSGGVPYAVEITPDGSKVVYAATGSGCTELDAWCRANGRIGVVATSGDALALPTITQVGGDPSWVGNDRVVYERSYIMLWDLASGASEIWFDDYDTGAELLGTQDIGQPLLSRDGRRLATVRGTDVHQVQLYDVAGDPASELPPATPTLSCASPPAVTLTAPTMSADGAQLFWEEGGSIVAWTPCAAPGVVVAQAGQPDWGPADPVPAATPAVVDPPQTGQPQAGGGKATRKQCRKLKGKRRKACLQRVRAQTGR